jgi:hypothetical protein
MAAKGRFTPEEWKELKLLPFLLHEFVLSNCGSEHAGTVTGALLSGLESAATVPDPVHQEVALDTPRSEWEALMTEARTSLEGKEAFVELFPRFRRIHAVLREELPEEHEGYVLSVLRLHWAAPLRELPEDVRASATEAFLMPRVALRISEEALERL